MTREEAIRRIKAWNLDADDMEVLSEVIPELKESEDEFEATYNGTQAFWKKILPGKTNAKLIQNPEVVDEQ